MLTFHRILHHMTNNMMLSRNYAWLHLQIDHNVKRKIIMSNETEPGPFRVQVKVADGFHC